MKLLVTGACGIVGLSAVKELHARGFTVRAFDLPTPKNRRLAQKMPRAVDKFWGDVTSEADVTMAVTGMDAVIHLAAIIPPLADREPGLAEKVNVGGTQNIVAAIKKLAPQARFIFTSSISVYGDRLCNPHIRLSDPLTPNSDDHYAHHKIRCEQMIRDSGLDWTIFRLSYIVSVRKLQMDKIMFDIPLDTSFEICAAADVARALAAAVTSPAVRGETLHIAGGEKCRITYREYLKRMFCLFGVGNTFLPEKAFKTSGFHCGFMETEKSQSLLKFQHISCEDYFAAVSRKMRVRRFFIRMVRALAQKIVFARSPYYQAFLRTRHA